MASTLNLDTLNAASRADFTRLLDGTYEHSPWIAERAWDARPFATLAALKQGLVAAVRGSTRDEQLGLIRAHPELAGKAMVARTLTAESTNEQGKAGLTQCTPEEFARIQQLNAEYNGKFGFPFILAVRGYDRHGIIDAFAKRVDNDHATELRASLEQIHRIAGFRLHDLISG
jgi:2-oxo-4-hydroxy-4-carboxy-5-ureidoimidazoline decarboxylase